MDRLVLSKVFHITGHVIFWCIMLLLWGVIFGHGILKVPLTPSTITVFCMTLCGFLAFKYPTMAGMIQIGIVTIFFFAGFILTGMFPKVIFFVFLLIPSVFWICGRVTERRHRLLSAERLRDSE